MATHLIIDARNKQVLASMDVPGEGTTIFAVDLITDTWNDFSCFLQAAILHEKENRLAFRNRYLRAALANLFAHLDGVISELYDQLPSHGLLRSNGENKVERRDSLKQKMFTIRDYLKTHKKGRLPYINLELKPIRDIMSHPSIVKSSRTPHTDSFILTHIDVYKVAISEVIEAGKQINEWLDQVCKVMDYERFVDTKKMIEKFLSALGVNDFEAREF